MIFASSKRHQTLARWRKELHVASSHETAHAVVAHVLGLHISEISLNAAGGSVYHDYITGLFVPAVSVAFAGYCQERIMGATRILAAQNAADDLCFIRNHVDTPRQFLAAYREAMAIVSSNQEQIRTLAYILRTKRSLVGEEVAWFMRELACNGEPSS